MNEKFAHPELMSAKYVEQNFGLSKSMVYRLLNRHDCGIVRIGGRKFFHRDTFLKWLADQATTFQEE